jgi:hypothetical protein
VEQLRDEQRERNKTMKKASVTLLPLALILALAAALTACKEEEEPAFCTVTFDRNYEEDVNGFDFYEASPGEVTVFEGKSVGSRMPLDPSRGA